ncbi:MAG: integrase domain-containing protein [Thiogranum sp.]
MKLRSQISLILLLLGLPPLLVALAINLPLVFEKLESFYHEAYLEKLRLKGSWTKGGKERVIPVRTESQREVLNRAHKLAGRGSLIPSNRNYVQQMRIYEGNTLRAGLSKMHGLRHAYAQNRYEEITGWKCPAAGGPGKKSLTPPQREIDQSARLTISQELGHERAQIRSTLAGNGV